MIYTDYALNNELYIDVNTTQQLQLKSASNETGSLSVLIGTIIRDVNRK